MMSSMLPYQLSSKLSFVAVSHELGFVLDQNGLTPIHSRLYVQVLKTLYAQPKPLVIVMEKIRHLFPIAHIFHAFNMLQDKGLIVSQHEALQGYMSWEELENAVIPVENLSFSQVSVTLHRHLWKPEAQDAYAIAQKAEKDWLPIVFGPKYTTIGPLFKPHTSPCPACLDFRLRQQASLQTWIESQTGRPIPMPSHIPLQTVTIVKEALKQLFETNTLNLEQFTVIDSEGKVSQHRVQSRPECPHCGNPQWVATQMQEPIHIHQEPTLYGYQLGYRNYEPSNTWKRFKHLLDPYTGIFQNFKSLGIQDNQVHVYETSYAVVPMHPNPSVQDFKMEAYGKGSSAIASKVSALCEGIERASLRYHGDEPIHKASLDELGAMALTPSSFQHFHPTQLNNPSGTHALGPIPRLFDHHEIVDWLPAWSLRDHTRRYVPLDAILYGQPKREEERIAIFESNGLSAGNTLQEGIIQGLYELIERDAVAIWWFNKLKRPAFETSLMKDDPWFMPAIETLQDQGCSVHFLDLSLDTAVPVVAAVGVFDTGYLVGYGCHLDPRLALNRALSELIQIKAIMEPVAPPLSHNSVEYLYPCSNASKLQTMTCDFEDPKAIALIPQRIVDHLAELGMDTIVINCTRRDIGMPVVKVIVPGLRAFRPRFGTGRLYDIPERLELMDHKPKRSDFNPMWLTIEPFMEEPLNHILTTV